MLESFGALLRVSAVVFKMVSRSSIVLLLVLFISVPSAVMLALATVPTVLEHAGLAVVKGGGHVSYVFSSNTTGSSAGCIVLNVSLANVSCSGESFSTVVYIVEDYAGLSEICGSKCSGGNRVFVDYRLKNVCKGKPLEINGVLVDKYSYFRGEGGFSYSIVLVGKNISFGGRRVLMCKGNVSVVEQMVSNVSKEIGELAYFVAFLVLASSAPSSYFGFLRISSYMSERFKTLIANGVEKRVLKKATVLVYASLTLIFLLYGVAFSLILLHFGRWFLRFLGILVPYIPPYLMGDAVFPTALFYVLTVASSAKALEGVFK